MNLGVVRVKKRYQTKFYRMFSIKPLTNLIIIHDKIN